MRVTSAVVQVLGGSGDVEDLPVERCLRESQVRQVVAGADQLQQVVVARWLVAP